MKVWIGVLAACGLLMGQVEAAAIIHVPADQPTIQLAINSASNGDTVQVAPGIYVENLNFSGKAIRVASDQGPQVTIIDGNRTASVVTFASGEGPQSVLAGFTIRNGTASGSSLYSGGGIRMSGSSPSIIGNVITNNTAGSTGGGIAVSSGSPLIQGNVITNNGQISGFSGGSGGGIGITGAGSAQVLNNTISNNSWSSSSGGGVSLFAAGTPVLQNNVIANNSAYSQGGGIYIVNQSDATIAQNLITGNTAGTGGGVYWLVPSGARGPYLINNTIYGNAGGQGSGVFADGFDARAQLVNNIIVATAGTAVMCGNFDSSVPVFQTNDVVSINGTAYGGACLSQSGLNGNISADPLFANAGGGDFHLSTGSFAIDSATSEVSPRQDFAGVTRPLDGNGDGVAAADMGIFEAPTLDRTAPVTQAAASPQPNAAGWNKGDVSLKLNATDNDGGSGVQSIHYVMSGAQQGDVTVPGSSASTAVTLEGTTTVSYSAMDNARNAEVAKSIVVKIDKSGPAIAGMPSAGCTLSPAKHQLIQVASISASDALSGLLSLSVTATSNEPDSGTGGGDVAGDIVISGGTVQLRAERAPSGKGRTYTIVATAQDIAGNSTTKTATCTVPK